MRRTLSLLDNIQKFLTINSRLRAVAISLCGPRQPRRNRIDYLFRALSGWNFFNWALYTFEKLAWQWIPCFFSSQRSLLIKNYSRIQTGYVYAVVHASFRAAAIPKVLCSLAERVGDVPTTWHHI